MSNSDPAFQLLCDLVASDRLVVMTGAGISTPLKRSDGSSLPSWPALLHNLLGLLQDRLDDQERADCKALLEGKPTGVQLIEAASILANKDLAGFQAKLKEQNTPAHGQFTDTHMVVVRLRPKGIFTFNYDDAQESAFQAARTPYALVLPQDEAMVSQILTSAPGCPFLLKAHGGIQDGELTLTHDSYRTLMAKNPAYRAFVQNLLTNCSLVIVGFGMSDPDFDLFLATLANTFGGPLQRHVLIRHRKEQSSQEVVLRRRFGIHTLYVDDYAQIPHVLREASVHAGPALEQLLRQSVESTELADRTLAHAALRKLGPTGKDCALAVLQRRAETERHPGLLAEVAYTIGVIDAASGKEILMKLVEGATHAAPAARALTVLRPVLGPQDLPRIAAWRDAFSARPLTGERIRRLPLFCEYLITYVQAKHDSDADLGSSHQVP